MVQSYPARSRTAFVARTGIGSSYDNLGVRLDLRIWHVAASAALGVSGLYLFEEASGSSGLRNMQIAPALGLRAFSGDSEGFVAAVNWTGHRYERSRDNPNSFDPTARLDTFTLTVGLRFRATPGWFLEAAVVAGVASISGHPSVTGHDSDPGPFRRDTRPIPDLSLGVGFEF
jgi:hypothetical protein